MSRYLKISLTILASAAVLLVTVAAVGIGGYYYVAPSLPRADELRNDATSRSRSRSIAATAGSIWEFGEIKRTPVASRGYPAAPNQGRARRRGRTLLRARRRGLPRRTAWDRQRDQPERPQRWAAARSRSRSRGRERLFARGVDSGAQVQRGDSSRSGSSASSRSRRSSSST